MSRNLNRRLLLALLRSCTDSEELKSMCDLRRPPGLCLVFPDLLDVQLRPFPRQFGCFSAIEVEVAYEIGGGDLALDYSYVVLEELL